MKTTEESVLTAMDCKDKDLLPFLPYILQDFWEIGADPGTIISLIKKHHKTPGKAKVLDLGSGKGAVSINIAHKLGYECLGIDAIAEFIDFSNKKAAEYNVSSSCTFEKGDIREKVKYLSKYDIIILGAIGQVFGNYYETLTTISPCLHDNGIIIVDDGFIEDESDFSHSQVLKKQELISQIDNAGMQIIDEVVAIDNDDSVVENYDTEFENLEKRCKELIAEYPEKKELFTNYILTQKQEYNSLKSEIIGETLVIKRK